MAGSIPSLLPQRITLMLNNLCVACGTRLGTIEGHHFHSFPTLERLCQLKEEELRGMGFGYRLGQCSCCCMWHEGLWALVCDVRCVMCDV